MRGNISGSRSGSNSTDHPGQPTKGAALLRIRSEIQSNKGQSFENYIAATNEHYERAGVAIIQKVPTPTKNVKGRIVYAMKSTIDFMGVMKGGRGVAFEAKETTGTKRPDGTRRPESSFQLFSHNKRMISEHQIRFLDRWEKNGGLSFVLIRFRVRGDVYRVPVATVKEWYKDARRSGRKSVPVAEFKDEWKTDPKDYLNLFS